MTRQRCAGELKLAFWWNTPPPHCNGTFCNDFHWLYTACGFPWSTYISSECTAAHTQTPAQVHINLKSKLIGRICRGSLSLFVLRLHFYLRGEHTNTHKGQIDHESSSQDWSSLHKIYLYSAVGSKQGGCLKARWENFGFFAFFLVPATGGGWIGYVQRGQCILKGKVWLSGC